MLLPWHSDKKFPTVGRTHRKNTRTFEENTLGFTYHLKAKVLGKTGRTHREYVDRLIADKQFKWCQLFSSSLPPPIWSDFLFHISKKLTSLSKSATPAEIICCFIMSSCHPSVVLANVTSASKYSLSLPLSSEVHLQPLAACDRLRRFLSILRPSLHLSFSKIKHCAIEVVYPTSK